MPRKSIGILREVAEDEQDAEEQAMMEVKQYLGDYITAYADEEEN